MLAARFQALSLASALQRVLMGGKAGVPRIDLDMRATTVTRKVPNMEKESPALRVLIVDDEPLICWSLAETLTECGHIVTETESGEAAVRALASVPEPDVVLLDYHLPDSRGLSLLSTVRRLAPRSQVILMSAYCTPEISAKALALGACRVASKPIDMHDVPSLVREAASAHSH